MSAPQKRSADQTVALKPLAHQNLLIAGVQFLEALADVLGQNGQELSPELANRAALAMQRITAGLDMPRNPPGE